MTGLNAWWRSRTLREQRLLLAMLALAAAVLAWALVIRPLADSLAAARARHDAAVAALATVRAQSAALGAAGARPAVALDAPLDTMLSNAAAQAGFPVTRVERAGASRATMLLGSVRPQAFFAWLAALEARGLVVERLSLSPAGPQTLQAQLTIRAGAA